MFMIMTCLSVMLLVLLLLLCTLYWNGDITCGPRAAGDLRGFPISEILMRNSWHSVRIERMGAWGRVRVFGGNSQNRPDIGIEGFLFVILYFHKLLTNWRSTISDILNLVLFICILRILENKKEASCLEVDLWCIILLHYKLKWVSFHFQCRWNQSALAQAPTFGAQIYRPVRHEVFS